MHNMDKSYWPLQAIITLYSYASTWNGFHACLLTLDEMLFLEQKIQSAGQ